MGVPWDGQESPFPARPVPTASTKAATSSGTAPRECPVVPKGNRSPWDSPGPPRAPLGLAQGELPLPHSPAGAPSAVLAVAGFQFHIQGGWRVPAPAQLPPALAPAPPALPHRPGPTARPPHTPTGHMGHCSCSAAAARELGNGSRPRSTEGSQELPNQSFLPLLGFTCSWAGADAGLGLCLK